MQNDSSTHGLWETTAPPAPPTSVLRGGEKSDVVVIGAGYTGLSTALHLREAGVAVSVIEAVEVGFGASGRNAGFVNAGVLARPDRVTAALGPDYGERLLRVLGEAPDYVFQTIGKYDIPCDALHNGTLHCAVGAAGLRDLEQRTAQWRSRGVAVDLLDAAQTAAKVGSTAYAGALWDHRAGTIQPLAYARGLARAALGLGAQIFTGSPVIEAAPTGAGWSVRTVGGAIEATWVVVATDAYATGAWSEVRKQQIHLPYFKVATRPLEEGLLASVLPGRHGVWDTKPVLSSLRLDRDGRLVFGSIGALRGSARAVHRAWAERSIRKLFPQFGAVVFESEWYGSIGMTDDSMPRFHELAPNVVAVSGYNGRGIAPGTAFGRLLAGYISGALTERDLPLPASEPRVPRLRYLREIFYDVGSRVVHALEARGAKRRDRA